VQEIKGEQPAPRIDPEIRLRLEAFFPEDYVPDTQQRMNLYKRLSRASQESEIDEVEDEILDLYGKAPVQVFHLLQIMRIRLSMKEVRILRLDYNKKDLILSFHPETPVNPMTLVKWAQTDHRFRLLPGDRLSYRIGDTDEHSRIDNCSQLLGKLHTEIRGAPAAVIEQAADSVVTSERRIRGLKKR